MRTHELQTILEAVKHNKSGSKQSLRKRIINLLVGSTSKTKALRQKIVSVYKSRTQNTNHTQLLPSYRQSGPQFQAQNNIQRYLRNFSSNNFAFSNETTQPYNELSLPAPQMTPTTEFEEFEDLPFFKTQQTLLSPMYCQNNIDAANFSGLYFLTDSERHAIVKSWIITKQEYKIQIILRFVQIGLKENIIERLPYNISVSVNDRQCKLPILNIPTKAGITPWRCNVPIDITQQTDLRNPSQNTLKICWSGEPHEYMAAVYVAEKLTWNELLINLKSRPLYASNETKKMIKKSMEHDMDMEDVGVDSMISTIRDPLSKTKMELPARGKDCLHWQCFDAIQFLQMNEQKQTWLCPLCKKKIKFENLEIDEFFLSILKSPNLSKDCEYVMLYENGSWSEKKPPNYSNASEVKSNDNQSNNQIDVITLSDSDSDDDTSPAELSNCSPPKLEESVIKSERIDIAETEDVTQIDKNNSSEHAMQANGDNFSEDLTQMNVHTSNDNDFVLDLSLKNGSPPTPSSDDQSVITLNDDSDEILPSKEPSKLFDRFNFPESISIIPNNNKDCKSSVSGKKKKSKQKHKSRPAVICTITLD